MKKFVAMLLIAGFLCANLVGCQGETKPAKDKDAKPAPSAPKEKDAPKNP